MCRNVSAVVVYKRKYFLAINIKSEELITMRENTKKTFNELFSLETFNTKLKEVIKELLNRYEK